MKKKLKWNKNQSANASISAFMREVKHLSKEIKDVDSKDVKLRIYKIIIKKLPKEFRLKKDDVLNNPDLLDMKKLKSELQKRAWAIDENDSDSSSESSASSKKSSSAMTSSVSEG